jgi:hypothetical protein
MAAKLGLVGVILCLGLASCGDDADPDDGSMQSDLDTGATCPSGSQLTYENFAREFFTDYCVECHSSERTGDERHGAPSDANFDSLVGVEAVGAVAIDRAAGAGPEGVRNLMPLGQDNPKPSDAERRQLSEWLACGLRP